MVWNIANSAKKKEEQKKKSFTTHDFAFRISFRIEIRHIYMYIKLVILVNIIFNC